MSGMLSQVEARQKAFAENVKTNGLRRVPTTKGIVTGKREVPPEGTGKTIAIVASTLTYTRLSNLRTKTGAKSLREAMLMAIDAGLTHLGC